MGLGQNALNLKLENLKRREFKDSLLEMLIISGERKISKKKLNKSMGTVARLSRSKAGGKVDWKPKYLNTAINVYGV